MRRARSEDGMVTAETAIVLPVLAAVTLAMVWLVAVGIAQMRVTDAAREAARAAARGESPAQATALADRAAPGANVTIAEAGDEVTVSVRQRLTPVGGLLQGLGAVTVHAQAVAAVEEQP